MALTATERTKVIVKKLPPLLPEADFHAAVDEVCQGNYDWFSYVPGKLSAKSIKHARAYLNFTDPLHVYDFKAAFDGHVFVNERGAQFRCAVEYAPYQKVPKRINKRDPREGTLEKDPEYQAFVAELGKDPKPLPSAEALADRRAAEGGSAQLEAKRVTSLMQFLQDKWSGKVPAADPSNARGRRGRAKNATSLIVEPPPGFAPLDGRGKGAGQKQKSSGTAKSDLEAAQQAVATALSGVSLDPSNDGKPAKGKSRRSSKDGGPAVAEQSDKPAVKILQKERPEEAKMPAANGRTRTSKPNTPAAGEAERPEREVRVRAGFQVYTPRIRPSTARSDSGDTQGDNSAGGVQASTLQAAELSAQRDLDAGLQGAKAISSGNERTKAVWQPNVAAGPAVGSAKPQGEPNQQEAAEGGLQDAPGKGQSRRRRGGKTRSKEVQGQTAAELQDLGPAESLPDQGNSLEPTGGSADVGRAELVGGSPPKRHRGRRGGRGRTAEGEPPPAKADGKGG